MMLKKGITQKSRSFFFHCSGKYSNKMCYKGPPISPLFFSYTKFANFLVVLAQRTLCGNQLLFPFLLSNFSCVGDVQHEKINLEMYEERHSKF